MSEFPSFSRRHFAAGAALGTAVLALPSLYAQPKLEQADVSIAVGGKAGFYYLPLTIAEQLGYFKAEGLNVDINDCSDGTRAMQLLVGGSADVCAGAFEHTINLQSKNQMFRAFVLLGRTPQISFGISTKTMAGFKTLADLKGKKIGVSAPGSSTNMLANLLLSRVGLTANDVSFMGVGTSAGALVAMRSGQIDAISNIDPVMTMLEQKGDVKIVKDTRTLKGTLEVFGGLMPAGCLYASQDFVEKNPNTCQAMAHAIVRSLKWLQTAGPADIIKTVPESYMLGDRGLYLSAFNKIRESISLDGVMPTEGPSTALKALSSFNTSIKPNKIDLSKTFTNEFAQRAKNRFYV